MTKRQKQAMLAYLEKEPDNKFLTAKEIREQFPDAPEMNLNPPLTFMLDNTIITIRK